MPKEELDASSKKQPSVSTLKALVAGTFAGWAQILVGQPFDTVKVRLQTTTQYSSAIDCIRKTLRYEGWRGFYKGTLIPLIGIGGCVAVQFAALSQAKDFFAKRNKNTSQLSSEDHSKSVHSFSVSQALLCGMFAGFANTPLATFIEHIRIRLQIQSKAKIHPFALIKDTARNYGVSSLFKGSFITLCREMPGYAFYFGVYELAVQASIPPNKTVNDVPAYMLLASGSLGGMSFWIVSYPIDAIKSKIQSDALDPKLRAYKSSLDCLRQTIRITGIGSLYRGFGPCMTRSLPANAATFYTYEFVIRLLGGRAY